MGILPRFGAAISSSTDVAWYNGPYVSTTLAPSVLPSVLDMPPTAVLGTLRQYQKCYVSTECALRQYQTCPLQYRTWRGRA
eukprot:3935051-Rhodomonas_salina.2